MILTSVSLSLGRPPTEPSPAPADRTAGGFDVAAGAPASALCAAARRLYHRGAGLRHLREEAARQRTGELLDTARALWRRAGYPAEAIHTWRVSIRRARELGEVRGAVALCREAEARLPLAPASRATVRLYNECGSTYFNAGAPAAAHAAHRWALVTARHVRFAHGEATALLGLGLCAKSRGELDRTLAFDQAALRIFERLADASAIAATRHNLGVLLTLMGRLEEARRALTSGLAVSRRSGDDHGAASSLTRLARVEALAGESDRALATLEQALAARRRAGDLRGEAVTLDEMADLYRQRNEPAAARAAYVRALAVLRRSGSELSVVSTLVDLARLDEDAGRSGDARQRLGEALALIAGGAVDRDAEVAALAALARLARADGDLVHALAYGEQALVRVEEALATAPGWTLRASYLATRQDLYAAHVDLLMASARGRGKGGGVGDGGGGRAFAARAFHAGEQARARGLLDLLAADPPAPAADPELRQLRARERGIQRQLAALELQRRSLAADDPRRPLLEQRLALLLIDYSQLAETLRRSFAPPWPDPGEAQGAAPAVLTLAEAQTLLDGDTLLLAYSLGEERSYLWLVGDDVWDVFTLPGRAAIEGAALRLYELLQVSHERQARGSVAPAAAALADLVLGPAAGRLGTKRLAVVGDGALGYVPFGVLPEPGAADAGPLLRRHEVVSLPSASVLARLRERRCGRAPPRRTLALVADGVYTTADPRLPPDVAAAPASTGVALPPLPSSRREAEAILAAAPADTFALLGFAADKERLLAADLADYRILHFATHGLVHPHHPELSALVLSQVDAAGRSRDGLLSLSEIARLRLAAELVVLSACDTALGRHERGEGLMGMSHGFLTAGASRVIVSLWSVDDHATAELMRELYDGLFRQRLPPSQALRQAQLALAAGERWSAPFYWAGFVLQGDWL